MILKIYNNNIRKFKILNSNYKILCYKYNLKFTNM